MSQSTHYNVCPDLYRSARRSSWLSLVLAGLAGLLVIAGLAPRARAGGVEFPDNGAVAIGRGGAYAANPDGALAISHNPARLAQQEGLRIGLEAALPELSSRSVLFQSSQGGEGATTIAAQFATLLAGDARVRPLLVDLHARRPGIGARFGIGGTSAPVHGVARASANEADDQTLAVLPLPESIAQRGYVTPDAVRALLASVAGHFDWILFDGPPVLESAEAVELAALMDGVVVVVEAGNTKRPVVTRAVELLRKGNARVLGSVLNRRRLEIPDFIYRRI